MKSYVYKFNLMAANVFSLIILVFMIFITIILGFEFDYNELSIVFYVLMIFYFILHEILHGLGYIVGGANPKNIYYGIALEKGIFYTLARQEVKKSAILISLQMPFTIIGLITYILGMIINNQLLVLLSIANIVGASMDLVMFFYIARIKNVRYSETDANDEFVLISKEDLTKRKSIFLTLKEVKPYNKKDFEFKKIKRIIISKISWILIIVLLLISLLPFILMFI